MNVKFVVEYNKQNKKSFLLFESESESISKNPS